MSEIAKIQEEIRTLGTAFEEYKQVLGTQMAEIKTAGAASADTVERLARLDTVLAQADEAKQRAEAALAAAKQYNQNPGNDPGRPELREYKAAVRKFMITGDETEVKAARSKAFAAIYGEEKARFASTLSDPDGGYLVAFDVDPDFQRDIIETSPLRTIARVQTTSRNGVRGRRRVARAGFGSFVHETASRSKTDTPRLGEWKIDVHEQYAYPEATLEELEDAEDAEGWIMDEVGPEFGYDEANKFFEGDGVQEPRGFLTYPTTDPGNGQFIASIEAAGANAIAADDLIDLQTQLKEGYQRNASWVLTRFTLGEIRKLDTPANDGGYLWQPGLQLGVPSVILGRPYVIAAPKLAAGGGDMHSVGSSSGQDSDESPIVAYGDFNVGYRIVDRRGITTLRDPYTNKPFIGFYMTRRVGGDVVKFEAIKLLTNNTA